jgi:hypothetical protein
VITALLALVALKAEWPGFRINEVAMAFKMPSKPDIKKALFKQAPATFCTSDSQVGRFVAGYVKFPESAVPTMLSEIQDAPGSPQVKSVLDATIAEFAKGTKSKIVDPQFGQDRGLPAEFATLEGPKATMRVRVYLGSRATYVFIAISDVADANHYFDSVKLTPEVPKR